MALKIIFMGTPEFAVPSLKSIANSSHKILEVYTQPAKKKNRGQKIQNSPIYECATKLNLNIRCPISLNKQDEFDHFKSLKPDLVVVVAYGKIIPANFLNIKYDKRICNWEEQKNPRVIKDYIKNYDKINMLLRQSFG